MEFTFGTYLWDTCYKGMDDYVWACLYRDVATVMQGRVDISYALDKIDKIKYNNIS